MRAEPSGWDSDVFGVKVGRLRTAFSPDLSEVRSSNAGLFDVVFVVCEGRHEPSGVAALDLRYDMEAAAPPTQDPLPPGPPDGAAMAAVLDIAGAAFSDSRLLRDPRLADRAGAFYRRWCSDARADGRLLVPSRGPSAFCVYGREPDAWRIELIAVAPAARGRGVGGGLVAGMVPSLGVRRRVRVSATNRGAIGAYESWGFLVRSISTAFHVWTT